MKKSMRRFFCVIPTLSAIASGVVATGCSGEGDAGIADKGGITTDEGVASVNQALEPNLVYVDHWETTTSAVIDAACPPDRVLVGGGFINPEAKTVAGSFRDLDTWRTVSNGIPGAAQSFASEALCLAQPASASRVTVTVDIPPHSWTCAVASCPSGKLMTGGGFQLFPANQYVFSSYPMPNGSGWRSCAKIDATFAG